MHLISSSYLTETALAQKTQLHQTQTMNSGMRMNSVCWEEKQHTSRSALTANVGMERNLNGEQTFLSVLVPKMTGNVMWPTLEALTLFAHVRQIC